MVDNPIAETHELCASANSLQILGHHDIFYDVEHIDGNAVLSPPCSPTKIRFRSAEYLGKEDWEWLIRGHSDVVLLGSNLTPLTFDRGQ